MKVNFAKAYAVYSSNGKQKKKAGIRRRYAEYLDSKMAHKEYGSVDEIRTDAHKYTDEYVVGMNIIVVWAVKLFLNWLISRWLNQL